MVRKKEFSGEDFNMWGRVLEGKEMTLAEKDEAIAEQIRIAKEASDTELGRQIRLFRQEITGVREELIQHRRIIANAINDLKKDVSDRLLNFTSYGEWLQYKEEIDNRFKETMETHNNFIQWVENRIGE